MMAAKHRTLAAVRIDLIGATTRRVGFITDDEHTWDAVRIGWSAMTGYWKSRPHYRTLRSNIGFREKSMNASGLSCRVSCTSPNEAGSTSSAGMTCCQNL